MPAFNGDMHPTLKISSDTLRNTVFLSHSSNDKKSISRKRLLTLGTQQTVKVKCTLYPRKSQQCMKREGWAKCSGVDFKQQVKAFSEALSLISENRNPSAKAASFKRGRSINRITGR